MTSIRSPHALSLAIHLGFAAILFTTAVRVTQPPAARVRNPLFVDLSDYRRVLVPPAAEGGGGGGDRSPLPVSFGQLPKAAPRQFVPPMIVDQPHESPLLVEPSLVISADVPLVNVAQWGDPSSTFRGLSNGPGSGGGMGDGSNGGIGPANGQGFGPGDGIGVTGLRSSTSAVVAPQIVYQVEPEFSDQARRAKHQGVVHLAVDIDPAGRPANIRVVRALGLGLDEKAIEAVSRWKFRAGTRDGRPVTMRAIVEVNFHLL